MGTDMSFFVDYQCVHTSLTAFANGKCHAMELACNSGCKTDKHQCRSGPGAMYALSDTVQSMSGAFASGSTASVLPPASPEYLTRAIQVVEAEEGEYGLESLMNAVDLFHSDPRYPIAYLAFNRQEMRSTWLHCQLSKAAEEKAILDFSMFPHVKK